MLPPENAPFADAHIENLEVVRQTLIRILEGIDTSTEELESCIENVRSAKRGFERYKVCFADEVKQKERLHEKALHCRLNHK